MSKTQNSQTALTTIPSGFGEVAVTVPEFATTPYIQFVYARSKNYGEVIGAIRDLQEGEPVLIQPAPKNGTKPKPIRLRPFEYFLLGASEFWGQYSQSGELVAYSSVKPDDIRPKTKWDQTVESHILVITGTDLIPATCRFKTTTCPAIYPAVLASAESRTEAWAEKGEDYAVTMRCPEPWARFYTHAKRTERLNREKQTTYPTMEAQVIPTSHALFTRLDKFFKDPANLELLTEVRADWRKRVEAARKKELVAV